MKFVKTSLQAVVEAALCHKNAIQLAVQSLLSAKSVILFSQLTAMVQEHERAVAINLGMATSRCLCFGFWFLEAISGHGLSIDSERMHVI